MKYGQTQELLGVDEIRQMIDLYNPCTDDYLFVLDFQTDSYYISPHARERFQLPGSYFHNVPDNLLRVTWPEDRQALTEDLEDIMSSDRNTHNLIYRWINTWKKTITKRLARFRAGFLCARIYRILPGHRS